MCGTAPFGGVDWVVIASDFDFIGGSMGAASGQRIVRAYEWATNHRAPVVVLAASGGARMQEGMVALIQMARTAAAAQRHAAAGLLQVAHFSSPTTGGVYASFASLADIIWAEPNATIGFAGPRVVQQTTGRPLPPGAHTAESAFAAGLLDGIMPRRSIGDALSALSVALFEQRAGLVPEPASVAGQPDEPWQQVQRVRAETWPSAHDVAAAAINAVCDLRSDAAVRCAIATSGNGRAIVSITLVRDTRPTPRSYQLARRAVALAARLQLPVVTFVDTPGADPSHESEQEGIAREIAQLMAAVATHPQPTVSIVTGEGGSGGALAFSACDRLYLLDGAVFSVIAPEGAAAILHRDAARAAEVAPLLKLTGADLVALGIVDGIIARDDIAVAIDFALATAQPGDGRARFDSATARAITES